MRKAPALQNNNGALQIRVRLEGRDYFINRLGSFDDPVARAKAQSISAEIWSDFQQGQLDWSLSRYQPLVEGEDPELLDALERLMEEKRQGRYTNAYRLIRIDRTLIAPGMLEGSLGFCQYLIVTGKVFVPGALCGFRFACIRLYQ